VQQSVEGVEKKGDRSTKRRKVQTFESLNVEEREVEGSKLKARRRQKERGEGAAGGGAFREGWAGERGGRAIMPHGIID
jgi:hypothetical protein